MEDAFALVVLTLLQLCRGEISKPEWFAANLINDSSYTPKPITEIFTSDSTLTRNPALFTQPTTAATSTLPPGIIQNDNLSQQIQTQKPPIGGLVIQQTPEIMSQVVQDTPKTELPNFVIIFDPKGQPNPNLQPSITSSPQPATQSTTVENFTTAAVDTSFTTESTTSMPSTQETITSFQPGLPNPQQILNTLSPPLWPLGSMLVYPIQFPNVNLGINSTIQPVTETIPTLAPQPANPPSIKPLITVRVKSPKGSITNIHINPTTTIRPSTTRRRKATRKCNDYEACVNTCKGKKEPICSSPMGIYPIDPDKLKGFASLCHMACHNSFRKEQVYEKVADGRCGRLRTRIRPVDKNKLNREELNKAQYTIVHNAPETIMEFSPLRQ